MEEKNLTKNYKNDADKREDRLGKYMHPWEDNEINYKDEKGTVGILRELYMYKKMYERIHNTIINVVKDCKDAVIKETLTKCLIDTEQLYVTQGILPPDYLFADELIIAYLLAYIRKNEIKVPAEYGEVVFFKETLGWLKDLSAKEKLSRALFNYIDSLDNCDNSVN